MEVVIQKLAYRISHIRNLNLVLPGLFPPLMRIGEMFHGHDLRTLHFEGTIDEPDAREGILDFVFELTDNFPSMEDVALVTHCLSGCALVPEEVRPPDVIQWAYSDTSCGVVWRHKLAGHDESIVDGRLNG